MPVPGSGLGIAHDDTAQHADDMMLDDEEEHEEE